MDLEDIMKSIRQDRQIQYAFTYMWNLKNPITERTPLPDDRSYNAPLQRVQVEAGVENQSHSYNQPPSQLFYITTLEITHKS